MDERVLRERMDCSFLRRVCMQQERRGCVSEERGVGGGGGMDGRGAHLPRAGEVVEERAAVDELHHGHQHQRYGSLILMFL